MRYADDRFGSKFVFIVIFVMTVYLAFFNFDVKAAYDYTLLQLTALVRSL